MERKKNQNGQDGKWYSQGWWINGADKGCVMTTSGTHTHSHTEVMNHPQKRLHTFSSHGVQLQLDRVFSEKKIVLNQILF